MAFRKAFLPVVALLLVSAFALSLSAHGPAPPKTAVPSPNLPQVDVNTRLLANLDQHGFYNDVHGYHAPNGAELAIIGTDLGTAFINATDPRNPVQIAFFSGPSSIWREMDHWGQYLYVVTEGAGGMQIFSLANPLSPVLVKTWGAGNWSNAHTIHIDRTKGHAYINGTNAGMVIVDLADPVNPVVITTYTVDYVHDCFVQNGIAHLAHIYSGQYRLLDVSNLPSVQTLDIASTPGHFTHSISVTADDKIAVTTDENSTGHPAFWDISNPRDVKKISEFNINTGSIVHNPYIIGNVLFASWYTDGFVAVNMKDPVNPEKLASYDTHVGSPGGYDGAWSCYPFQPSGATYIGDMQKGLFILQVKSYPTEPYGEGLAGSGGFVPAIDSEELPSIGNANFHIEATDLLGGAPGAFLIGFGRANVPFLGGTLLVDLSPFLMTTFVAQGTGAGAGTFKLPMPLPNDLGLVGLVVDIQLAQADPGAVQHVSLSNGLELKIGEN